MVLPVVSFSILILGLIKRTRRFGMLLLVGCDEGTCIGWTHKSSSLQLCTQMDESYNFDDVMVYSIYGLVSVDRGPCKVSNLWYSTLGIALSHIHVGSEGKRKSTSKMGNGYS